MRCEWVGWNWKLGQSHWGSAQSIRPRLVNFLWPLPIAGKWQCLARRDEVWHREPVTLHPSPGQTPGVLGPVCFLSGLQTYLCSEASSHSLWPPYHYWGLTRSVSRSMRGPAPHPPPVSVSILGIYGMAFRQYKVWIRLSELFRDIPSTKWNNSPMDIFWISPDVDDHFIKYLMGSI